MVKLLISYLEFFWNGVKFEPSLLRLKQYRSLSELSAKFDIISIIV